jgi:hypothetical protein
MRLLAAIRPPEVTQAILDCLDLQSRAPPMTAALPDADDTGEWSGDFDQTH